MKTPTEKDYGFVCLKIDDSIASGQILNTIENMIDNMPDSQICVFNSYNERTYRSKAPIIHLNQSKFFYGNLFLFDIRSAIITRIFPNIHKRYYYATDIPWEKNSFGDNREWAEIFNHENIEIIAQNQHIADIYEICWKKPILIAEDFEYETIKKILD